VRSTFARKLGGFGAVLALACTAAAAGAKETAPLPEPLACPIDAPVRVASSDTLKRFSALAMCSDEAVIVAPYRGRTDAREPVRVRPLPDASSRPIMAAADAKAPGVFRKVGADGGRRTISISLPADAFRSDWDLGTGDGATYPAGGNISINGILALQPRIYTTGYDELVTNAAARHGVDPLLLHSVIKTESAYRANATSAAGARGLMQIMPATGVGLGVRHVAHLYDAQTNIDAGARLLRRLWVRYEGQFDLVLAAYNAGEGAVARYGNRVPPYAETQAYVGRVKGIYQQLAAANGLSL